MKYSLMKKILVIDDDKDILEAIKLILESGGYESKTITKGDKTSQYVLEYKPDLIILDILLSGTDGRKICKMLKKSSKTKNIPVIMISAHPSARDSVEECGADSFVAKPFSVVGLLAEVKKFSKQKVVNAKNND